jgi:hypothetical protein
MFTAALPATDLLHLRAFARCRPHRKHSFPSVVASVLVYRAVDWQRVDEICYNIFYYSQVFGHLCQMLREGKVREIVPQFLIECHLSMPNTECSGVLCSLRSTRKAMVKLLACYAFFFTFSVDISTAKCKRRCMKVGNHILIYRSWKILLL